MKHYIVDIMMMSHTESVVNELRRGAVVLAVLAQLREEQYGYSLREQLATGGLEVPEGTLYPLLRRLEGQGFLESRWQLGEGRPRRYYRTSEEGERALGRLGKEWHSLIEAMARLMRL